MPTITLTIRNVRHQIACSEADIPRLTQLAERFRQRVDSLAQAHPRAPDSMLLILAGLMLEDALGAKTPAKSELPQALAQNACDEAVASAIDAVADYVEALASKLEKR
jgi:cell division protein ZapA (FtsZ GTPase activity inhibitor)